MSDKPMSEHLIDKAKLLLADLHSLSDEEKVKANDFIETLVQAAVIRVGEYQRIAQQEFLKNNKGKRDEQNTSTN